MPGITAVSADSPTAAGVDTALLDCWQSTLTLGLLAHGCRDVLSVLGSQWWFGPPQRPGGPPRLDSRPEAERLEQLSGLRPVERPLDGRDLAQQCAEDLAAGRTPLVITDGFLLPWCPYFGVRHIEHSFAVVAAAPDKVQVVDAYDNRTEWGPAEPLDTKIEPEVIAAIEQEPASRTVTLLETGSPTVDAADLLRQNAADLKAWEQADPFSWFLQHHLAGMNTPESIEAFCEATWTIERRRRLYAVWLDSVAGLPGVSLPAGFPERFRTEVVAAWTNVNRFAYLALRRIRGGRASAGDSLGPLVAAAAAAERATAAELVAAVTAAG